MEGTFNRHLGSKLRLRRLALGLTQTKVAQAINVTFQQVQKYEKGTNGISSLRLMQLANRFQIPVVTFVDTPGAYPGIGAEQRGQASAIANSIECCMSLTVPNISIIIGEGGSGGAIALASSNRVIMLENSIYSVISPEGCASILWRDPSKSLEAAEAMKLTAKDLLPNDATDSKWANMNPSTGGSINDPNLLTAGWTIGVNSVSNSLRNANLQLRSEPPNPQQPVSPWMISTIGPDTNRKDLEIGSQPYWKDQ